MMMNKLIRARLTFVIMAAKRSAFIRSNNHVGDQMKLLNDNKQFEKTLELFDKYKEKNIEKWSNWVIIQALKACTKLGDLQRGTSIHHLISSRLKHDPYVLPALIHFYGRLTKNKLRNNNSLIFHFTK